MSATYLIELNCDLKPDTPQLGWIIDTPDELTEEFEKAILYLREESERRLQDFEEWKGKND